MLTAKENMRQAIIGGTPDRFVNQYEAMKILMHPMMAHRGGAKKGETNVLNSWGITMSYPNNVPGAFPVHTADKIVVKDIEHWQDYVKAPSLDFPQAEWDAFKAMYDAVDHEKAFTASFFAPGLFEQVHYLCSMTAALEYYIAYPDELHDMIKYLTEFEMKNAEQICANLHPEMMLHHDDWGSSTNSFLRPTMFEDFFLDAYKEIYGYYHDHGCELVIHHADSYAVNLVPDMIEMGIDIWQGCMHTNNVPELVKKYGDKITFMGNIDNKFVDFDGWTPEDCQKAARNAIAECDKLHYIPCITQGGPGSVYPGTYMEMAKEIDRINCEKFGFTQKELDEARVPWQLMF